MATLAVAVIARILIVLSLSLLVGTVEKSAIASADVIELVEPAADLDDALVPTLVTEAVADMAIAPAIHRDRPMPASIAPSSLFRPPRRAFV